MPQHSGPVTAYETKSGETNGRAWTSHNITIGGNKMSCFTKTLVQPLIDAMGTDKVFTVEYSQNEKGYKTIEAVQEGSLAPQGVQTATEGQAQAPTPTGVLTRAETMRLEALKLAVEATASIGPPGDEEEPVARIEAWYNYFGAMIARGKGEPTPNAPDATDSNTPATDTQPPTETESAPVAGTQPDWLPNETKRWGEWVKHHGVKTALVRKAFGNKTLKDYMDEDAARTAAMAACVVWEQHAGVEVDMAQFADG